MTADQRILIFRALEDIPYKKALSAFFDDQAESFMRDTHSAMMAKPSDVDTATKSSAKAEVMGEMLSRMEQL